MSIGIVKNTDMKLTKSLKVLIIEDDIYYAAILEKNLKNHMTREEIGLNYDVKIFQQAESALQHLEKDTDIVIMDYYLENDQGEIPLAGMDLLKAIKNYCPNCKTIVVSASSDPTLTMSLFDNGIYEFIHKDRNATEKITTVLRKIIGDILLERIMILDAKSGSKQMN
jgi:DNA-binding NtrC family response regulator